MIDLNEFTIVGHPLVPEHPMWTKMWQRAGLDPKLARSRFQPIYQGLNNIHSPVIALGEQSLRYMTGQQDLFRWRGRQMEHNGRLIYPTLQPDQMLPRYAQDDDDDEGSGLNHSPARFQGVWVWDILQALKQAQTKRVEPDMSRYSVDPPRHIWQWWVDHLLAQPRISFDIETAYKMSKMNDEEWESQGLVDGQVLRISFCGTPGLSVSVSWTSEYMEGINKILASNNIKIGWNCANFDVPKLEAEGHHVGGIVQDYQDAFHILESDLPKGLEWVTSFYTTFQPWKHLNGSNPGLYSCIDADAALQNAIGIDRELAEKNQTHLFERHVVELMPLLKQAGKRGCAIDLDYSHALEDEMVIYKTKLEEDVQPLIPEELKPRKHYKREPEDMTGRIFYPVEVESDVKVCSHCNERVSSWVEHMKGRAKGTKKEPDVFNRCKAAGATSIKVPGTVIEWDEVLPWNPNSADQLKEYIRHHNHPMGKNRMTDQDSASGKHLEKLVKKYAKKHPIYQMVADYKKVAKTISTYVYHNYADPTGFIHSTYKNGPSTWRLAASDVNLTNVGKRETNKWAVRARRQIVSRPGYVFVGADSTSIEAVIVGRLIGDDQFIAMAGKSIHVWLCCQELGWEFNDTNLEIVKTQYKDLYNKMKTAIYLLLYGGDPYLMHMENPDSFPTLQSAREIQDKIFKLIPKLKEWQERTRERAKKEGVLTSLWGYKHYFYDVYTFKRDKQGRLEYDDFGKPIIKLGKDGKRCLAFEPQNCAAGFGRDTLLLIGQSKWAEYMPANVFVHDGYTLEVPIALAEEAEQFLVDILTRPVPELGGLRIGCETEMGYNWANVDSIDPKTGKFKFWPDGNPNGMRTLRKVEC